MKRRFLPFALAALLVAVPAFGVNLGGSLKFSLGGFYNSSNILDLPQQFEGKIEGVVGDPAFPDARYQVKVRARTKPFADGSLFQLREAWVKAFLGPIDLSFGNQVVTWGITDMFSPEDLLNASDYTIPFDAEKLPTPLLRATARGSRWSLDLIGLPFWTMPTLPDSRWMKPQISPPSGVAIVRTNIVTNAPAAAWSNIQFGARFKASADVFQGIDLGVQYFQGFRSIPLQSFSMRPSGFPGSLIADVGLSFPRYQMIGADLTVAFKEGPVFRAEGGYKTYDGTAWFADATNTGAVQAVAALEYTFLGVRAILEYVYEWGNWGGLMSASGASSHTGLLILSRDFGSRLSAKVAGGYRSDSSFFLVPQLQVTLADGLSAQFRTYLFFGEDGTIYGQFRENKYGEMNIQFSF